MIELTVGDTDAVLDVALYMLIFLKFIQSIIPNIEYDYTGKFEIKVQTRHSNVLTDWISLGKWRMGR